MATLFPHILLSRTALTYFDCKIDGLAQANHPSLPRFKRLFSAFVARTINLQQFVTQFEILNHHPIRQSIFQALQESIADVGPHWYQHAMHPGGAFLIGYFVNRFLRDIEAENPWFPAGTFTHIFHEFLTCNISPGEFLTRLQSDYPGFVFPQNSFTPRQLAKERYTILNHRMARCNHYAAYNQTRAMGAG